MLEKWMKPSLFEGMAATDETTWCAELGAVVGWEVEVVARIGAQEGRVG